MVDLWFDLAQKVLELSTGRGWANIMAKYMLALLFTLS